MEVVGGGCGGWIARRKEGGRSSEDGFIKAHWGSHAKNEMDRS
jgi:hypothetical protein